MRLALLGAKAVKDFDIAKITEKQKFTDAQSSKFKKAKDSSESDSDEEDDEDKSDEEANDQDNQ